MVTISDLYVITPEGLAPRDERSGIYREDGRVLLRLIDDDETLLLWWDNGIIINGEPATESVRHGKGYQITNYPVITTVHTPHGFYGITDSLISVRTFRGDHEIIGEVTPTAIRLANPPHPGEEVITFS